MAKLFDRYRYYENSVQTPQEHVDIFSRMFRELRKKDAMSMKEDFCGTFLISCAWVMSHPERTAIGVDLDPEPIAYGKKNGLKDLNAKEKKRVTVLQKNVLDPLAKKSQIIGAGNFSFFIFKKRAELLTYFKSALKNLSGDGIFILEMAGGPGFIQTSREQRTYKMKGGGKYTYYWDQKSYDPVNAHGMYAIHFKEPNGKMHKNVFVYDWRVWTIPELQEIMLESGFRDVATYWETTGDDGKGTGEYVRTEVGTNDYAWIAFVVGIK
jgi:hypothetical protein